MHYIHKWHQQVQASIKQHETAIHVLGRIIDIIETIATIEQLAHWLGWC